MARKRASKPYFHKASGFWCTSINRKREYLDKDYKVACRKLKEIHAEQDRINAGASQWFNASFATLADEFLEDVKSRRKKTTYDGYRTRLLRALQTLGGTLRVCEVNKLHLAKIERNLTGSHSPTTIRDTLAAVQTVFGWAIRLDILSENPLVGYDKPAARTRNRIIEDDEFQALLRNSDVRFRRVLIALRHSGCRPKEVRSLVWEWVDLENGFWVFPDHKAITQQRQPKPRIVPLPDTIWRLCRILANTKAIHDTSAA